MLYTCLRWSAFARAHVHTPFPDLANGWVDCVQIWFMTSRAAESESEPESESVGVGCFVRSRSRSRQNLSTPTDSGQALIPDSKKSPCRLFIAFFCPDLCGELAG